MQQSISALRAVRHLLRMVLAAVAAAHAAQGAFPVIGANITAQ